MMLAMGVLSYSRSISVDLLAYAQPDDAAGAGTMHPATLQLCRCADVLADRGNQHLVSLTRDGVAVDIERSQVDGCSGNCRSRSSCGSRRSSGSDSARSTSRSCLTTFACGSRRSHRANGTCRSYLATFA